MKMPILLSSYQAGNGRESIDAQSGVYCSWENGKKEQQRTVRKLVVVKERIMVIYEMETL